MAKGIYVGVNGVARKVKKIYVGVDGVARKVKKIYVGVGGVARLCFSAGIAKISVPQLSYNLSNPTSISGTVYAFIGQNNSTEVYDANLVSATTPSTIGTIPGGDGQGATWVDQYSLFMTNTSGSSNYRHRIEYYTGNLTLGGLQMWSLARGGSAGGNLNNVAMFGGGRLTNDSGTSFYDATLNYVTSNLSVGSGTGLSIARVGTKCQKRGAYLIFGGGVGGTGGASTTVDYYSDVSVRGTLPNTQAAIGDSKAAASNDTYAIFNCTPNTPAVGGYVTGNFEAYAYSNNLVRATITTQTTEKTYRVLNAGASTPDLALFAGGTAPENYGIRTNRVISVDKNLVVDMTIPPLMNERYQLTGATIGDKVIFAGGIPSPTVSKSVDAYII